MVLLQLRYVNCQRHDHYFEEKTKYVCDDLNFSGNKKIFNLIYAGQHVLKKIYNYTFLS